MESSDTEGNIHGEVFKCTDEKWRIGQIKKVVLQDIGGHEFLDISMSPGINLITGGNGSGKSSLVSAIALLCGWKGRKAGKDSNLARYIRIGAPRGIIRIYFANSEGNCQVGYLSNLFGDEIIVERIIYQKGSSCYTFRGSKIDSPTFRFQEAKKHLMNFREFSNIIINNPVTLLTQSDSKFLIREQGSPKSLYEFFQRAHLFDLSWKYLSDEQLHLEKAELMSQMIKYKIEELEGELDHLKKEIDILNECEILEFHEKNLNNASLLSSAECLFQSICNLENLKLNLIAEKTDMKLDELFCELSNIESEREKVKLELSLIKKEQEHISKKLEDLLKEFSSVSDRIMFYSDRVDEVKKELDKATKLLSLRKRVVESDAAGNYSEKEINEFLTSQVFFQKKLDLIVKEKKDLLATISQLKTDIYSHKELLGENRVQYEKIVREKKENSTKINELIREVDDNKSSLCKISGKTRDLNFVDDNSNTDISSMLKGFVSNKVQVRTLTSYYSTVYNNYTEFDFIEIFGYSKDIHNRIIAEFENISTDVLIAGPIALHVFAEAGICENNRLLYKIDEIIGGKIERQDKGGKYIIRRNYKYWIVGSSKNKNLLLELFKSNGIEIDPTLIFIRSQFQQKRYDLSVIRRRYPKAGLAIIDLLEIRNDEVFNFLVDITQIEATFIFYNDVDLELIYDYNLYIKRAYSLEDNSYRYRRGGIVVAPEIHNSTSCSYYTVLKTSELNFKFPTYKDTLHYNMEYTNVANLNMEKEKCTEQIAFIKKVIKISDEKIENLKMRNTEIDNETSHLECALKNIEQEIQSLNAKLLSFEQHLSKLSNEEHSISIEIDRIKIETERFSKEKSQDKNKTHLEIMNIENQIEKWSKSIAEYEEKVINEKECRIIKDNEIKKTKNLLECRNQKLLELDTEIKSLETRKGSLVCEIQVLKEKEIKIKAEIDRIDFQICEKKKELELLEKKKDTYFSEYNHLDLSSTFRYFGWEIEADTKEHKYPNIELIGAWRDRLKTEKNSLYLDYSRYLDIDVAKLKHSMDNLHSLREEVSLKYEKKRLEFEDNKREFNDEVRLLEMNKRILDKRIEQLRQKHVLSGKCVNNHFKYYFSIFWSNTMKPHLKFDHDKSTLNIHVIPDTAILRNGMSDTYKKGAITDSNKNKYTSFMNREIQSLSGGESSSIGISLLLALSQNNPSPFHLFDEPDVYMDDVRRITMVRSFIEFQRICSLERSENTRQVIFVTPHDEIIPFIKENYSEYVHIIQFISKK